MATNPMQRKARNSFLLGMVVTLLICAVIAGLVYVLLIAPQKNDKDSAVQTALREVYVVKSEIKSGSEIKYGINVEKQKADTGLTSGALIDVATLEAGSTARIDLPVGTIVTAGMINTLETPTNDVRLVELNMITLQTTLQEGDYIDIRLTLPTGQDFIVISKKQVISLNGDTLGLHLTEEEILVLNSAIVEAYTMTASNLHAVQYVEPGIQEAATYTYRPTDAVVSLINIDTNIIDRAKNELIKIYNNDSVKAIRQQNVDTAVSEYSDQRLDNIEAGIQEQIEKAKQAREDYLGGLAGY